MTAVRANRLRWPIIALFVAALVLLGGAALLRLVQTRSMLVSGAEISEALSRITGHRVSVALKPDISRFPGLAVTLRGLSLHDWQETDNARPVLTATKAVITLSPWAALTGRVDISGIDFGGLRVFLKPRQSGLMLPVGSGSKLAAAVAMAKLSRESNSVIAMPEGSGLLPATITIEDGRLIQSHADGTEKVLLDQLSATLRTPSLDRSVSVSLTGVWRDEHIKLTLSVGDMMMLLAGGESTLAARLDADTHAATFDGRGNLGNPALFSGAFTLETDSLAGALAWNDIAMPYPASDAPLTLSGNVAVDGLKWQFSELSGRFGGSNGRGSLTILPGNTPVSVAGTLDFDTLDLAALASTLAPEAPSGGGLNRLPEQRQPLDLDLRVSASRASLGTLSLRDLAATTRTRADMVSIDINNAALFGGTTQLALKINRAPVPAMMELRLLAESIDMAALAAEGAPWLAGLTTRASLSAILNGPAVAFSAFPYQASGTLKLNAGSGELRGLALSTIVSALTDGQSVPLARAPTQMVAFDELLVEGDLSQGLLNIRKFRAGLPRASVQLGGTVTLDNDGLALSGAVTLEAGHANAGADGAKTLPFLISGTRTAAVIGPVKPANGQP
jgi:AsmA protein